MGGGVSRRGYRLGAAVLSLLVGVTAGVGGYTFWYAKGASYLSNDPRACVNCHIMQDHFDAWQKASHHSVATCNSCHVPHDFAGKYLSKMINGYHHSRAFTLQNFHEPIQITPRNAAILQQNCVECHAGVLADGQVHGSPSGQVLNCVKCHADVGHGPPR